MSEETSSDQSVLIQGVELGFVNVPLHHINLKSDIVSGPVTVGVRNSLPVENIQLLLGNDLAGDKVVVNPLVTSKPSFEKVTDPIEQEFPDLYPACAVTRAMAQKAIIDQDAAGVSDSEVDLSDTFMVHSEDQTFSPNPSLDDSDLLANSFMTDRGHKGLTRSLLIAEQEKDPELKLLCNKSLSEDEVSKVPTGYFKKDGVLMRKWRPPDIPADNEWKVNYQIVVPKCYRQEILNLAHDTPLAGHLG